MITPKMVKKVITNFELLKGSGPNFIVINSLFYIGTVTKNEALHKKTSLYNPMNKVNK